MTSMSGTMSSSGTAPAAGSLPRSLRLYYPLGTIPPELSRERHLACEHIDSGHGCAAGVGLLAASLLVLCAELPSASHEARAAVGRASSTTVSRSPPTIPRRSRGSSPRWAEASSEPGGHASWCIGRHCSRPPRAPPAPANTDGDGYADAYLARLDAVAAALHAEGIRIILTPSDVPPCSLSSRASVDSWPAGTRDRRTTSSAGTSPTRAAASTRRAAQVPASSVPARMRRCSAPFTTA